MIRHILFPVDFSKASIALSAVVRTWAEQFQARVTLLHVLDTSTVFPAENYSAPDVVSALVSMANSKLGNFLVTELASVEVERVVVEGSAAAGIVDYAQANSVDLIMMPTLGYTRFRQMLLGSVTAAVLHDTEIPVWTSAHLPTPTEIAIPEQIVCAVDCGPQTSGVVRFGIELAQQFKAVLKVVHSRSLPDERFETGISKMAHEFAITTTCEDYTASTAGLANAPELEIVHGPSVTAGIQTVVNREAADLLVIGRGKIHGVMGRLRTNAHDLIRLSGCPVLSI